MPHAPCPMLSFNFESFVFYPQVINNTRVRIMKLCCYLCWLFYKLDPVEIPNFQIYSLLLASGNISFLQKKTSRYKTR